MEAKQPNTQNLPNVETTNVEASNFQTQSSLNANHTTNTTNFANLDNVNSLNFTSNNLISYDNVAANNSNLSNLTPVTNTLNNPNMNLTGLPAMPIPNNLILDQISPQNQIQNLTPVTDLKAQNFSNLDTPNFGLLNPLGGPNNAASPLNPHAANIKEEKPDHTQALALNMSNIGMPNLNLPGINPYLNGMPTILGVPPPLANPYLHHPTLALKHFKQQQQNQNQHLNNYTKPPYSYSCLIALALRDAPRRQLKVGDIYIWIETVFPWYKKAPQAWRNSVRHNLSLNKSFEKVPDENAPPPGLGVVGKYWNKNLTNLSF